MLVGVKVYKLMQGTLPSSLKRPTYKPMWRGVTISYAVIVMCLLPLAVCGSWAYGNKVRAIVFIKVHYEVHVQLGR